MSKPPYTIWPTPGVMFTVDNGEDEFRLWKTADAQWGVTMYGRRGGIRETKLTENDVADLRAWLAKHL